jgi:hypothetical protein
MWFTADDGLRPEKGSPAIDAGDNGQVVAGSFDVAGARRVQEGSVDLGPYEYGDIPISPSKPLVDVWAPVIILASGATVTHEAGTAYVDAGATWTDLPDGNGTVEANGTVNERVPGIYVLTYDCADAAGNQATTVIRAVTVTDRTPPIITLAGDANVTQVAGTAYVDAGATWTDLLDGNGTVEANGTVNALAPGDYVLTYAATDSSGNTATPITRTVTVVDGSSGVLLLSEGANRGSGWKQAGWFGYYFGANYPWVYHETLGWLFVSQETPESVWLYEENLGWLWTGPDVFPYLYLQGRGKWSYFDREAATARLYDYDRKEWFEPSRKYLVTAVTAPADGGTVTGGGQFQRWEVATLEALPAPGFAFAGWEGLDAASKNRSPLQFEVFGNVEFQANFTSLVGDGEQSSIDKVVEAILNMDNLSEEEKKRSLAELLVFGKSDTAGIELPSK